MSVATATVATKPSYTTPDREDPKTEELATVTPLESTQKQVRFDGGPDSSAKRGLVSRRGGRYSSPSRLKAEAVLEYKTYRSPPKKEEGDGIPSLCSAQSLFTAGKTEEAPESISCDKAEQTSPLASNEEETNKPESFRNVTFSPRPSEEFTEKSRKTPLRSPSSGGHFHNLPSLQDAKLSSPCGIFLSPCPPSPSAYATIAANPSMEEEKSDKGLDRERAVATPTDFAVDFGKGHHSSASFDASNVLAWLQSPSSNGLFSPGGGFGSVLNTPRGGLPRTPRTPTMSTSFFFSDVASLPRNGEFASPNKDAAKRGVSSMISISPLTKRKSSRSNTPLKGVFTSPRKIKPRSMPLLGDSPRGGKKNLEAVHMAERDLMEDEDLSVLLQLASHSNTPRSKDGSDVFRSPRGESGGYRDSNNPALQLPIIGGQHEGERTAKLSRKASSRDQSDPNADDFAPPPLGIRSTSSGASREVYSREDGDKMGSSKVTGKENGGKAKGSKISKNRNGPPHPAYSMYPPRSDAGPYPYPLPPMPPGGSMKVVVGASAPMSSRAAPKKSAGSPSRHPGTSPQRHPYSMPPDGYGGPPPHGSMYPPPPHHHYPPHIPPYGHYPPPPRHLPAIYPHPQASKGAKKSKTGKREGNSGKRPAESEKDSASLSKKARKTPPKSSPVTKKKKTPSSSSPEPVDRQKTAATIAAVNAASGGKNDRAAALAAAILRGVTMRPSGKWQAQLYYAGKSRYIGVFDTREKAALAYEIAREKLKSDSRSPSDQCLKATENAVNAARKAAFEGVNEKEPRIPGK